MQDVRLVKYQGAWIAHVTTPQGHSAFMSLFSDFSDDQAQAINTAERATRIRQSVPLLNRSLSVEEEEEELEVCL